MGIEDKLNALNAAKPQELVQAAQDKRIDDKEAEKLGLTATEQQELTAALNSGQAVVKQGQVVFTEGFTNEPESKEEKGFWGKAWDKVKKFGKKVENKIAEMPTGVKAVVSGTAGLAAAYGVGHLTMAATTGMAMSGPAGWIGLGVAALVMFGLSSCKNDAADMTQITKNIWINDNSSIKDLLNALIAGQNVQTGVLMQILANQVAQGKSIEDIKNELGIFLPQVIAMLTTNNDLLSDIYNRQGDVLDVVVAIQQSTSNIENLIKNLPDNLHDKFKDDLDAILEAIKSGNSTLAKIQDTINNLATNIVAILDQVKINGATQEEIRDLLAKIRGGQLKDSEKLSYILKVLAHIDWTTTEIKKDLDEIKNDIKKMLGNQIKANAYLEVIAAQGENGQILLEQILKLMQHMDNDLHCMSDDNKKYFQQLIISAGQNTDKLQEILLMLQNINSNVVKGSENIVKAIAMLGVEMAQGMNVIIGAINANTSESKNIKELLEKVLAKMDKMDKNNKVGFKAILNALEALSAKADKINNTNKAGFEAVLKALGTISDKIDTMDANNVAKLDVIIDKLQVIGDSISQGVTVDTSVIETLLTEIRELTKANGGKLDDMIVQYNVLIAAIQGMNTNLSAKLDVVNGKMDQLDANQREIIDFLKDLKDRADRIIVILNNPKTCKVDFDKLMAKLQEILDAIKNHTVEVNVAGKITCECNCGGSHKPNEGLIGELDDLIS